MSKRQEILYKLFLFQDRIWILTKEYINIIKNSKFGYDMKIFFNYGEVYSGLITKGVNIIKMKSKKITENFHEFTLEILSLLNKFDEKKDLIKKILYKIKKFTSFDAVGIRLKEGENYPYYETSGFDNNFIKKENNLCSLNSDGEIIKNCNGQPHLECMCGIVIRGKTEKYQTYFTEGGSFWTNNTSNINRNYLNENFSVTFRFTCSKKGYKSIALIPIYSDDEIIGLLQLNHKKVKAFTPEMIKEFEKIANIIGVIFKRKELEKQIIEQKAELEYNQLKTKFFSKISHEFRTPINLISNGLEMIKQTVNSDSTEDNINKYLNIISKNKNRLLKLTNNLIDIIKIEDNVFTLNKENVDIVKFVEDIIDSVRDYIEGERRLEFHKEFDKKVITCDISKMERALLNLLSNAVKFTDNNDLIRVSIYQDSEQEYIFISVKDTGKGLNKKEQEMIFESLNQVDDTFTRNNEGLGMGLTIVREIVKIHDGEIKLKSELNEGAEFIIKIPDFKCNNISSEKIMRKNELDMVEVEFSDIK